MRCLFWGKSPFEKLWDHLGKREKLDWRLTKSSYHILYLINIYNSNHMCNYERIIWLAIFNWKGNVARWFWLMQSRRLSIQNNDTCKMMIPEAAAAASSFSEPPGACFYCINRISRIWIWPGLIGYVFHR